MRRNVVCNHAACPDDAVLANVNARCDNTISTNPHIIVYHNLFGDNTMLVNAFFGIRKTMIQTCNYYALCQIDMTANPNRTNDRIMQSNPTIITYQHITHAVVYTRETLHHTALSQSEHIERYHIHPRTEMDDTAPRTMSIEWA